MIATRPSGPVTYGELRQRSSQEIPGTLRMTLEPVGDSEPALTPDAAYATTNLRSRDGTSIALASVRDPVEGLTFGPAWVIVARGVCLRDAKGELVSDARGNDPSGLTCSDATFQVYAVDAGDGRTLLSTTGYDAGLAWTPDVAGTV
jgi:hypothetical protein